MIKLLLFYCLVGCLYSCQTLLPFDENVKWSGKCKEGLIDGWGILKTKINGSPLRIVGVAESGKLINGKVKIKGRKYDFKNGVLPSEVFSKHFSSKKQLNLSTNKAIKYNTSQSLKSLDSRAKAILSSIQTNQKINDSFSSQFLLDCYNTKEVKNGDINLAAAKLYFLKSVTLNDAAYLKLSYPYFQEASDQGKSDAYFYTAFCLFYGAKNNVPDYTGAIKWAEKAIATGEIGAMKLKQEAEDRRAIHRKKLKEKKRKRLNKTLAVLEKQRKENADRSQKISDNFAKSMNENANRRVLNNNLNQINNSLNNTNNNLNNINNGINRMNYLNQQKIYQQYKITY